MSTIDNELCTKAASDSSTELDDSVGVKDRAGGTNTNLKSVSLHQRSGAVYEHDSPSP